MQEQNIENQKKQDIFHYQTAIGTRIKELRELIGLSQDEFALKLNFKQSYISRIELGNVNCTLDILISLYQFYAINPNYILLGYEPKFMGNEPFKKENTQYDKEEKKQDRRKKRALKKIQELMSEL